MTRVLLVDDEEDLVALLAAQLGRRGFDARCASSVAEARSRAGEAFDVLVSDRQLPDGDAAEVASAVPARVRLLLSGSPCAAGPRFHRTLLKPVDAQTLADAIAACMAAPV